MYNTFTSDGLYEEMKEKACTVFAVHDLLKKKEFLLNPKPLAKGLQKGYKSAGYKALRKGCMHQRM